MVHFLTETLQLIPAVMPPGEDAILTLNLLAVCRQVLPVLDKLGQGLSVVRIDISGNIERLQKKYDTDPTKYKDVREFVRDEKARGVQADNQGCTKGLLWLTRAMTMIGEILHQFADGQSPYDAANAAYDLVLRPYHGYLTFGVFKVAINFCPTRESFLRQMDAEGNPEAIEAMRRVKEEFGAVLRAIEKFLTDEGCNFPDRV